MRVRVIFDAVVVATVGVGVAVAGVADGAGVVGVAVVGVVRGKTAIKNNQRPCHCPPGHTIVKY